MTCFILPVLVFMPVSGLFMICAPVGVAGALATGTFTLLTFVYGFVFLLDQGRSLQTSLLYLPVL